ncbi:hypothetical protein MMC20_001649 [Loxospora ochrophaea]|nr:hypothetical protein [Loxospora ochrophaea]
MSLPIKFFTDENNQTPNPRKVEILFAELGIKWEKVGIPFNGVKDPSYTQYNPNGRVPCIIDPNKNDLVIWESGAIIEYLITEYDPDHKVSFPSAPEKYQALTWLHFQMSGQGPYFGQAMWFSFFHPEQIESAKERYIKEIDRVSMVLDGVLKDKEWLVGGKCSYADLAFYPWYNVAVNKRLPEKLAHIKTDYPNMWAWIERIEKRPGVKKGME